MSSFKAFPSLGDPPDGVPAPRTPVILPVALGDGANVFLFCRVNQYGDGDSCSVEPGVLGSPAGTLFLGSQEQRCLGGWKKGGKSREGPGGSRAR